MYKKLLLPTAVGAAVLTTPSLSYANTLDEVLVTAQRKTESMQDVPIAIVTAEYDTMEKVAIQSSRGLERLVPNMGSGQQNASMTFFMRGVGTQNTIAGVEPSVAVYVDGVYFPSTSSSTFSLNNIERIEVLKGPQGTLFGRNATGGVIQVITKDPGDEPTASLSLGYDEWETTEASFYGATPIGENLGADLALYHQDQGEGYGESGVTGDDVMFYNSEAARTKWVLESDDTVYKLALGYSEIETDLGGRRTPGPDGAILWAGETRGDNFYTSYTHVPLLGNPKATVKTGGASLHINHDFGDYSLVSITGYSEVDTDFIAIADSSAVGVIALPVEQADETFSQELQLQGDTGNLDWIVGAYYYNNTAQYDRFETLAFQTVVVDNIVAKQDTESHAVFAQGTMQVSERGALTVGARYTRDERDFSGRNLLYGFDVVDDVTDNKSTFRLAYDYAINDDLMTYVSYNTGFKSGQFGFNELGNDPVDPEELTAYEIGLKSTLFDHSLRLNSSLFYYDYTDLQSQQASGTVPITVNAGDAEIYGLDIDFEALLGESTRLFGGLGLMQSEYKDFTDAIGYVPNVPPAGIVLGPGLPMGVPGSGNAAFTFDASGNQLSYAPDVTASLGATYTLDTSHGYYDFTTLVYYTDDVYYDFSERLKQDAYTVVNASIQWSSDSERYRAMLWVDNLFDQEYSLSVLGFGFGDFSQPARPQTVGFKVTMNFL
ncbi:TonB-dependent receptor [Haliea salexigens]|uniref:TonB-dependent receptor n=1 Tax=Haliea salexigens TaxID=287487 RepID=UPI00130EB600|nr:TonB-dependent receptor [Haliea salexigens]